MENTVIQQTFLKSDQSQKNIFSTKTPDQIYCSSEYTQAQQWQLVTDGLTPWKSSSPVSTRGQCWTWSDSPSNLIVQFRTWSGSDWISKKLKRIRYGYPNYIDHCSKKLNQRFCSDWNRVG